ncbi:MAG: amidohydrolase [Bradyrhizobium sp.]|nr:amidohydrolase [Bradyrhizobium sp.]
MIIDTHIHVWSYPTLENIGDKIETAEDVMLFRARYPELFARRMTEAPIDNSDVLVAEMDRHGIDRAFVQATPGVVTNDQVARSVSRHPSRLFGLFRIGHDQAAGKYLNDPAPTREAASAQIVYCVEKLGMIGMGEIFPRAFTRHLDPELIAADLQPIMEALETYRIPLQIPTAWTQFAGGLHYGNPLWVDEIAARHSDVPIILTKMGRGMQYYFDAAMTVAMRNSNVHFDTPGTTPEHLRKALDTIGSKRILFGSDWSATWRWVKKPVDLYTKQFKLLEAARLSDDEREDILWRNAVRLFQIPQ